MDVCYTIRIANVDKRFKFDVIIHFKHQENSNTFLKPTYKLRTECKYYCVKNGIWLTAI